ncbi:MAG: FAD-binding oxidoreductase [Flavobacteriales bacterium]|nr:FAD-binding oxidoreductase [Flavobacteriales bacterium]
MNIQRSERYAGQLVMHKVVDLLIAGHGLAGAVLAETARQRGLSVHVFDTKKPGNASTVAAGMVNPLVLRRFVPSWRADEMLPLATAFYEACDQHFSSGAWHPLPVFKIFPSPAEANLWERAMAKVESAPFMTNDDRSELVTSGISAPHGFGTIPNAAWLDVLTFLSVQREHLEAKDAFSYREVRPDDVEGAGAGVRVHGKEGRWLVHCTGPFSDVKGLVPVKGETLLVRIPGLEIAHILHRGVFLLPLGAGLFRVGSTFKWSDVWDGPSEEARTWLLARVEELVKRPVEMLGQEAGVRPASRDRRPLLGLVGPHEALFNGLGARGVLLAPWSAAHLLDHLFSGQPLDPEVDLRRFA